VDYVGDVVKFEKEFNQAILVIDAAAKQFNLPENLKLSVHSGSDKFSIYNAINKALKRFDAGVHVKTAGTTWLEELIGLAEAGQEGLEIAKEIYSRSLSGFDGLCQPYAAVIEINMSEIKEPIVACPNDPDDVKTLTEVHEAGLRIEMDEVFVGSCMTNIGLFRANAEVLRGEGPVETKLWICPPTKMDEKTLQEEGYYSVFGMAGARIEPPGCSLCMGNQAAVKQNAWVFSTSTRNFDNRLGKGSQVYLGSAELAAVVALKGKLPTASEYLEIVQNKIKPEMSDDIYKYLNFNKVSKAELEAMVE